MSDFMATYPHQMTSPPSRSRPVFDFGSLLTEPACRLLAAEGDTPCHLVGGALRDAALGCPSHDFDFIVSGYGLEIANRVARKARSRVIRLGGDRFAAYRIAVSGFSIDIWDRGEQSLRDDLERRDFTIHSFALDVRSAQIIDPFSGCRDLRERRLRATTPNSFATDPLRVLRLCRLLAQFPDLTVDPTTEASAQKVARAPLGVASERIRAELDSILSQHRIVPALDLLLRFGQPSQLWTAAQATVLTSTTRTDISNAFGLLEEGFASWVEVDRQRYLSRLSLLGHWLASRGGSCTGIVSGWLHSGLITRRTARELTSILSWQGLPSTRSQQRWFLHCLGPLWPIAAYTLCALQDDGDESVSMRRRVATVGQLARREGALVFEPRPLVDGFSLGQHLGIPAGERLGRIRDAVFRAQIEGRVNSTAEALTLARKIATEDCSE